MQSKIICPECRKEAIVPAGGVKDLPNNFFINRMVDELVLKRKWRVRKKRSVTNVMKMNQW